MINSLDAVHVASGNRMQGGQVCRGTGLFITLPNRFQDSVRTAKSRRGRDSDHRGIGDQLRSFGGAQHRYISHISGSSERRVSGEYMGTRATAGLPRLELDWKLFPDDGLCRPHGPLQYELGRPPAGLSSGHSDAAQRWSIEPGLMHVVEPDHPYIGSDAAAHVGDCVKNPERDYVAEANDAIHLGICAEQPHRSLPCLRPRRLAHNRAVGVERQAVRVQEFLDAAGPLGAGRGVAVTAHKSDATTTMAAEMLRGRISAVAVLRAHIVDIHSLQAASHQHQGGSEQIWQVAWRGAVR